MPTHMHVTSLVFVYDQFILLVHVCMCVYTYIYVYITCTYACTSMCQRTPVIYNSYVRLMHIYQYIDTYIRAQHLYNTCGGVSLRGCFLIPHNLRVCVCISMSVCHNRTCVCVYPNEYIHTFHNQRDPDFHVPRMHVLNYYIHSKDRHIHPPKRTYRLFGVTCRSTSVVGAHTQIVLSFRVILFGGLHVVLHCERLVLFVRK
jgi:hypothetical protein